MSASTSPDNITFPISTDSFGPLETAFAVLATSVQTALNGTKTYRTADHTSLAAITGMAPGALATVIEGGAIFDYNGTIWIQSTPAIFATTSARDTAYAKAGGAYRVLGAQVRITAGGYLTQWSTISSSWRSVEAGLVRIVPTVAGTGVTVDVNGKVTFVAATTISLNNCFSADFDHFLVSIDCSVVTVAANLMLRLRAAGVDLATASYQYGGTTGNGTATPSGFNASATGFYVTRNPVGAIVASAVVDVWNPATAVNKRAMSRSMTSSSTYLSADAIGLQCNAALAYDGLTLINDNTGTMTGVMSVFGYSI